MGRKHSVSGRLRAVMMLDIALIIFGLAQSGIAHEPTTYKCGFLTIELDGSFSDWPANALWHKVTQFKDPSVFGEPKLASAKSPGKKEGVERMKTEKQSKIIDGVERLQWGKGQESTYMGALTVAMRAIGEDVTYDYLMGVSGAAFRLHFHQPGWCPSSPDATCGFNHSEPAMKALGYAATGIHSDKNKPQEVKEAREAVVQSINDGHPVLAIDLIDVPDWGVIVGYSDDGEKFLCRTYFDKTEEYSRAEKWPWVVEVIGKKGKAPDRKESLLRSLRIAIDIANTEKYEDYASGFSAYESWAGDLMDDSGFEALDKEKLSSMTHTNAWCYNSLIDAREAAIRYLRSIADEFGKESATHLSDAAGIYEEIVRELREGWKYAPFPWQLKDGKRWTKEMRHAEAEVLKETLALERKAISKLQAALDSAKEAVSTTKLGKGNSKVLLEDVVKEFNDLIGHLGQHGVVVGQEVYIQPCVYLSMHLVQMRAAGWTDMDFDQIAAVSSASALFAYEPGEFMPKYANLSIGMDKHIADATGFGYEWVSFEGMDGAWELLRESIDSGRSVKGWHWENIMFAGYQDAAKPEDRKVFAMADGPDTYAKWLTWQEFGEYVKLVEGWKCPRLGRHTERVQTKPDKEIALRIMRNLVEWSTKPPEHLLKKYPKATFGLAGIQLYADDCADMEKYQDFGSCHDINPQWPIRNSTAVYLRQLAEANIFPNGTNPHILKAAEEYRAAYEGWLVFYNHLSHGCKVEGSGKMKEHRVAGEMGIRNALEHEKSAIAELGKALKMVTLGDV